ncbi:fungal hydrophobin [Guyanagaster necrorhizus]|uniref:Hydrophobin n=1 Tax=Guyanagaster necrorhizus TaxID=856835 RepID=A0A9P7VKG3_9AGAR|nr:fungal hydrophobin [Guyanagaster necrorhizus MCA 3950]KAG7442195.1 fungal hydrophobin [Guyanagaster necrorhizus MCA 3950]
MFARIFTSVFFAFAVFVTFAAAGCTPTTTTKTVTTTVSTTATTTATSIPASECSTGNTQCCNALERADDSAVGVIFGLLGVVLQDLEALVGITCSPIDLVGIGQGTKCASQTVCCQNNTFNGLIAIGCVPIIINL